MPSKSTFSSFKCWPKTEKMVHIHKKFNQKVGILSHNILNGTKIPVQVDQKEKGTTVIKGLKEYLHKKRKILSRDVVRHDRKIPLLLCDAGLPDGLFSNQKSQFR
jgi:hypothetical protein